jgi:hypothetical protein
MTRGVWLGLVGWMACACSGNEPGPGPGPGPGPTPEERRAQLQDCIVTRLPPPAGSTEPQWTVSGYALVGAYRGCLSKPEEATAADFRAVMQGLAEQEEDPSRVRLTQPDRRIP